MTKENFKLLIAIVEGTGKWNVQCSLEFHLHCKHNSLWFKLLYHQDIVRQKDRFPVFIISLNNILPNIK